MAENIDLSKSKIMYINDFIFRQNLEFYPNLKGLNVDENILIYSTPEQKVNEALTFDLRTLPGEVWELTPNKFIDIIKTNKDCKSLFSFIEIINKYAFEQVIINANDLELKINNYLKLYFKIKESFNNLTEDNKILISNIDNLIATIPHDTAIGNYINKKLDEYYELTKTIGDEKGKSMALVLKNKNLPSLIEEEPIKIGKAGFINVAILIYGLINIGIIIAIALLK